MLQKIRDNSKGFLALALMFLLFLSFAIWGIDFQFGQAASPVVVNGEPVPLTKINRVYQAQLSRYQQVYPNGIPPLQLEELKRNILRTSAQEEVVFQHAYDQGFRVSDQALANYVGQQEAWQLGGQFSFDQFALSARQQGYSPEGYEEIIRRALVTEQIRVALLGSSFLTANEREQRGALEQETRTVSYFVIPSSRYADDYTPSESDVSADYDENMAQYQTVEAVKLNYIELNPEELAADMEVNEDELRSIYDAGVAAGSYVREETRKSSHILIAGDTAEGDDEEALATAKKVLERVRNGEDFAELAAEFSDDPGSKSNGGALDWSPRAAFVGPFSDALFSMQPGDVSEPVKTRFGYHVIRLDEIRADEVRTYEDVRAELAQEERLTQATARVDELSSTLDDLVYDYDDTLEPASDETDLPLGETGWITRTNGPGIGADPVIRDIAFSDSVFTDRRNSTAVRYRDGFVYLRIAEHRPSRQRTLDEMRAEITTKLKREAAAEAARLAGVSAQEKLTRGTTMTDVAAEFEAAVTEAATLQRRGGGAPPELSRAAFASPTPSDGTATIGGVRVADNFGVFAVEKVNAGPTLIDGLTERYAQGLGGFEFRSYIEDVYADADVVLNPNLIQ
ncbi:MAG: SurA N-terminal domain-containing protein [Gammaproteobacteria bacterium]